MGKSKFWQIYKKKQSNQIDWIIFFLVLNLRADFMEFLI